jgi:iron transport multicopper oxidase
VPTLYSAATTNESNADPSIYGLVNPFVVNYGDVVQIVVNNQDAAIHPFHLHGHQYQVLSRPKSGTGNWSGRATSNSNTPIRKDTLTVNANSHAVIRYVANNPGVFLFHCHIEWHVEMGLTATIIEAPDRLRGLTFPDDHIQNCKLQDIPFQGNAGGNTKNFTDTSNFNTAFPTTYEG